MPIEHSLTLHTIPAPTSPLNRVGMSWDSPGQLVRGVLVNELGKALRGYTRTLGHAGIEVQAGAVGEAPARHFLGSVTFQNPRDFRTLLLRDQIGLGMLFDNVPGRLESPGEMQVSLDEGAQNGRLASVRFLLAPQVAHALLDYAAAFERAGVHERYGLEARPLCAEGAGCSAFSMAFLELAGVLEPRFVDAWSFSVRVPERDGRHALIGGTKRPGVRVSLARVASLRRSWATPEELGIDIFGWDPTRMTRWIQARCAEPMRDASERVEFRGQAPTLVIDARSATPDPRLMNGEYFSRS